MDDLSCNELVTNIIRYNDKTKKPKDPLWKICLCYFSGNENTIKKLINDFKTSNEKDGKKLEKAVEYLLKHSGLFECIDSNNPKHKMFQFDHVGMLGANVQKYLNSSFNLRTSKLFIGESKDYSSDKIDVSIIFKHFGQKVFKGCTFGAIFCRNGITGNASPSSSTFKAASSAISHFASQRPKNLTVIFSDTDWDFISEHPSTFGSLLLYKFIELYKSNTSEEIDYLDFKKSLFPDIFE